MLDQKLQLKNNKDKTMPEDKAQQQSQQVQQQPQGGEAVGMSRTFPENSSLEVLNNRRIDQIVAKREADRMKEAQAIKFAQQDGIAAGQREGYDLGTSHGLEYGYKRAIGNTQMNTNDSGLGKSLNNQTSEPDVGMSKEDAIAQQSVV